MKKYVKGSNFQDQMCLVNKYDEIVCELIDNGDGTYSFPPGLDLSLSEGDEYMVKNIATEVD